VVAGVSRRSNGKFSGGHPAPNQIGLSKSGRGIAQELFALRE
jgi:hypothetical protein